MGELAKQPEEFFTVECGISIPRLKNDSLTSFISQRKEGTPCLQQTLTADPHLGRSWDGEVRGRDLSNG
jgi:hypothetical protein